MKPSDDKIPEELRERILEQMPWLNNPIKTIPIVDPADLRPCGNSLKILKHNPVNQERCAYSIAKPRRAGPEPILRVSSIAWECWNWRTRL